MDGEIKEIELHVAGLAEPGRADKVREVVVALDAGASVTFEPAHDLVRIASRMQTLEVTAALLRAGFEPTAMTG